jgi:hypothetical protein
MMFTADRVHTVPPVDIQDTRRFLVALDHSAKTFCFQSFDDQGRDLSLARTFHGPLDECAPALARLNERGAGIFTTVNVIAAEQRRTAENVVRVRAVFVDVDDPTSLPK